LLAKKAAQTFVPGCSYNLACKVRQIKELYSFIFGAEPSYFLRGCKGNSGMELKSLVDA
jgi:hypothetical protein